MSATSVVHLLAAAAIACAVAGEALGVTAQMVREAACQRAALLGSAVVNLILVPLIAVVACRLLALPPAHALGLLLMSFVPFAPMVPSLTRAAGGDTGIAVAFTLIFAFADVVTVPLLSIVLPPLVPGLEAARLPLSGLVVRLGASSVFPAAVGLLVRSVAPAVAGRIARILRPAGNLLLFAVVLTVLAARYREIFATFVSTATGIVGIAGMAAVLGHLTGGPDRGRRQAATLGAMVRNVGVAAFVAVDAFRDRTALPAIACYALVASLLGHVCIWLWRRERAENGRLRFSRR